MPERTFNATADFAAALPHRTFPALVLTLPALPTFVHEPCHSVRTMAVKTFSGMAVGGRSPLLRWSFGAGVGKQADRARNGQAAATARSSHPPRHRSTNLDMRVPGNKLKPRTSEFWVAEISLLFRKEWRSPFPKQSASETWSRARRRRPCSSDWTRSARSRAPPL